LNNNNTYKKNIKQFAYVDDSINELVHIFTKYNNVKNYVYSRYSGIKSIKLLSNSNKFIRDEWMKNNTINSWGINKRYVRSAISDATSNIKSMWSNLKNSIRKHINNDKKLSDNEKHYIRYVLKCDDCYYDILNHIPNEVNDKFNGLNKTKLNNYIRRITRLYKPNIGKSKSFSMKLEEEVYSYKNGFINIMSLTKGKRLSFKTNTVKQFKGTINLILKDKVLTISKAEDCIIKKINENTNIIGIDKNFINVIDTSNETSYGEGLNDIQKEYSNIISNKTKKRNEYYSKIKELKKENTEDSLIKINNIIKNNLGKIKFNKVKNKHKDTIKKVINKAINDFIEIEKPKVIVCEDISFTYSKHKNRIKKQEGKGRGKKVNLYLGQWMKGYLNDRLEYKSIINRIELKYVNAAYTSQTCNLTGLFGVRRGELFYPEGSKEGVYSGYNSAKIIRCRLEDKEISLKTPPYMVKAILQKRLSDNNTKVLNRANQDLLNRSELSK
jgi:hypothetical protein